MSPEEFSRPSSKAASRPEVIHRRWVLSKRADDGRALLVREDQLVQSNGFVARPRRSNSTKGERVGGTPALT